jgi:lipopolysaccharide/colanic/teichoic acid biosynthesis glycosyltransferase
MPAHEHQRRARATIEAHARATTGVRHAVFTWSLADAIEAVLAHLDLPPGTAIAVPGAAPIEVDRAIRSRHHRPVVVAADPDTRGISASALRHAIDDLGAGAVIAWRPAGRHHDAPVLDVLSSAAVPVVDAGPRLPLAASDALRGAVASCISLGRPSHPAAIVLTDDEVLASTTNHHALGTVAPHPHPGAVAPLDRWAATVAPGLEHDVLTDPDLARSYQLLVDALATLPGVRTAFGPVMGWGEGPTFRAAFADEQAWQAVSSLFALAPTDAVQVTTDGDRHDDGSHRWHAAHTVRLHRPLTRPEADALVDACDADRRADLRGVHAHQPLLARTAKRAFDVVVGCCLIAAASPLLALIAVVLRLSEHEAVLFRQIRVGRHGQHFHMLKFRTMVVGADRMIDEYRDVNERSGPLFKLAEDPRATVVGRVLRRTSLDELPQLFNVVAGTMSLVGPRPALPAERAEFPPFLRQRECVRPGITGLWQVEARDDASFDRYAELDLAYVHECSLALDLSILGRTPDAVIRTALKRPSRRSRSLDGPAATGQDAEGLAAAGTPRPHPHAIPGAASRRRARRSTRRARPRPLNRR